MKKSIRHADMGYFAVLDSVIDCEKDQRNLRDQKLI